MIPCVPYYLPLTPLRYHPQNMGRGDGGSVNPSTARQHCPLGWGGGGLLLWRGNPARPIRFGTNTPSVDPGTERYRTVYLRRSRRNTNKKKRRQRQRSCCTAKMHQRRSFMLVIRMISTTMVQAIKYYHRYKNKNLLQTLSLFCCIPVWPRTCPTGFVGIGRSSALAAAACTLRSSGLTPK